MSTRTQEAEKFLRPTRQQIQFALARETPESEIHFFPKVVVGAASGSPKALCVPYCKRQFVEDRLDEVVGSGGWQTDVKEVCGVPVYGIGIKIEDEWIWKWDTGADDESTKSNVALTGGIKRVGRLWGIGRDVSRLESKYRPCQIRKGGDGKARFYAWDTPPSVAELVQFAEWKRRNSATAPAEQAGTQPEYERVEAAVEDSDKANGTRREATELPGGGRIGGDPTSQFWHTARSLLDAGEMTQEEIDKIMVRHKDNGGKVDYELALAELKSLVGDDGKSA